MQPTNKQIEAAAEIIQTFHRVKGSKELARMALTAALAHAPKGKRGVCPQCGYDVAITKGGKWHRHAAARGGYARRGGGDYNICPMSGYSASPSPAQAGAEPPLPTVPYAEYAPHMPKARAIVDEYLKQWNDIRDETRNTDVWSVAEDVLRIRIAEAIALASPPSSDPTDQQADGALDAWNGTPVKDGDYRPAMRNALRVGGTDAHEQAAVADQLIGQIEDRFPNWRSFRDLIDCIDCTLADLRRGRT